MLERLKALEEMGRERMTKGPTYVSDTLRVHVWKFGFEKVKETTKLNTDFSPTFFNPDIDDYYIFDIF